MTSVIVKSLSSDFGGNWNQSQFDDEVRQNSGAGQSIVPNLIGTELDQATGDITITFDAGLSAGELTTLDGYISSHIPNPIIFDTLKFVTTTKSNYVIKRKSVKCDTSGGNITVELKKADRQKDVVFAVQKINASNTVTIVPQGGELIDGASTKVLTGYMEYFVFTSDGTKWIEYSANQQIDKVENIIDASITSEKGDLYVDDGHETVALSVGDSNQTLIVDSTQDTGLKYGDLSDINGYIADEHVSHSSVSVIAGVGLSGGGTITTSRTLNLDVDGLTADATPDGAADYVLTYDTSAGTHKKVLIDDMPGGGGGGDVSGPASSLDMEMVRFNGTGGKTLEGVGIRHYGASATDPVSPTPQAGDKYYNTAINHEMCYDASRGKWLSVATLIDGAGRSGTTSQNGYYRRWNGMTLSATLGPHVAKGTIIRIGYSTSNAVNHTYQVIVGGVVVASLPSGGAASAFDDNVNADFNAGIMSSRNASGSSSTSNFQSTIYYKLRA